MRQDIWKIVGVFLFAILIGAPYDRSLECSLVAAVCVIAWQLLRMQRLGKWIDNPNRNSMNLASGQAFELYRQLSRRNQQNQQRKRRLSSLISEFRRAIGALPDAIVLIDTNRKIVWANANALSLLGIRWPDDAGVRFSDLIRDPEVEELLRHQHDPNLGSPQGVEIKPLYNKEQTISLKVVQYTEGMRMIIARDVSRLIQVNQIHTDFVANVSHELKTPLTVLKGYLEIMQENDAFPDAFKKPLEQMSLQSLRMQLIVNDLLYLAKLENRETEPEKLAIDMTHLLNTIVEAVQPLIEEKRHILELDIDYQLKLFGAQTEIHSAFSNLVTNAIHYTEPNGTIKISWQKSPDGAEFRVKDNGLGIAQQHLERLTQRFYRVDTDRSREGGGTGLGLAIVKHVLQRHHAELDIESAEGLGSTFICRFGQASIALEDKSSKQSESTA